MYQKSSKKLSKNGLWNCPEIIHEIVHIIFHEIVHKIVQEIGHEVDFQIRDYPGFENGLHIFSMLGDHKCYKTGLVLSTKFTSGNPKNISMW